MVKFPGVLAGLLRIFFIFVLLLEYLCHYSILFIRVVFFWFRVSITYKKSLAVVYRKTFLINLAE